MKANYKVNITPTFTKFYFANNYSRNKIKYLFILHKKYFFQDVLRALNRNPRLRLPAEVSYSVIQPFIREACKLAWGMSALAHPLEIALATDSELFDDSK